MKKGVREHLRHGVCKCNVEEQEEAAMFKDKKRLQKGEFGLVSALQHRKKREDFIKTGSFWNLKDRPVMSISNQILLTSHASEAHDFTEAAHKSNGLEDKAGELGAGRKKKSLKGEEKVCELSDKPEEQRSIPSLWHLQTMINEHKHENKVSRSEAQVRTNLDSS